MICGPFSRDNVCHQAEHAVGGKADDHHHDLHDDFLTAIDEVGDLRALAACCKAACAEEDGDNDDRQHVGVYHGLKEVIREDVDDNAHNRWGFLGLIGKLSELCGGKRREVALEKIDQHKTNDNGERGCEHVVDEGFQTD